MKLAKDPIEQLLDEVRELRREIRRGSKRLFTVPETAYYLGVAPKSIRNGLGPKAMKPFPVRPVRVAGRVLFRREDLEKFCDVLGAPE